MNKMSIFKKVNTFLVNGKFLTFVVIFILFVIYFYMSLITNKSIFTKTEYAYYNLLLNGLFDARLDLPTSFGGDLSLFNGKWYMYWGPAPIVFIFLLYLILGSGVSDVFYTLIAGMLNILFFYLTIKEIRKYFDLKVSLFSVLILIVNFALISPNFYLSFTGKIWHTSQIIAILYLILFLFFYFKFLNSNLRNFKLLIFSVIFFNLAWFSRITLFFHIILFFYPVALIFLKKDNKRFIKSFSIIVGIIFFFVAIFSAYNYLRFNNFFETGISYTVVSPRYQQNIAEREIFSILNIKHNIQYYFGNIIKFSFNKPFVNINPEGNSMFFVYPIIPLLVFLLKKKSLFKNKTGIFLSLSLVVILINLSLLMLYFATGWMQFGSRYLFDIIPIMFILLFFVLDDIPHVILYLLLLYGVYVNFFGTLVFYNVLK